MKCLKCVFFFQNEDIKICVKWGKVMIRGKMIFRSTSFNIQMASFDK